MKTPVTSNHLGNVLVTVSARPRLLYDQNDVFLNKEADVTSVSDYYPFGMLAPARHWQSESYRFAFNGKERDNEGMGGGGSTFDYGFRIYNGQIGRFLSVDPLTKSYPWYTPYQFAGNKPIWAIDLDGLEEFEVTRPSYFGINYVQITSFKGIKSFVDGIGLGGVDYIDQSGNRQRKQDFMPGSVENVLYNQFIVPYFTKNTQTGFDMHYGPFKDAVGNYITTPGSNPQAPGNFSLYRGLSTSIKGETTIFFANDGFLLSEQGIQGNFSSQISELDELGQLLMNNPDYTAVISGYTDKDASEEYNLDLSQKRIDSITGYLNSNFGIDRNRMLSTAKGKTEADTNQKRAEDRKVEISVITAPQTN
ncbi:MAG: OmpA family protein [Bacteroidales bacterium]|nr:OmpA family protein [Bacteroidales bacterium]